jgi:beta-ureidopropionase / N-carbamoyl-L-amino-acid hydrolase
VFPNSRNVIPGQVRFTVDFRHPDDAGLQRMDAALRAAVAELCGPGIDIDIDIDIAPVVYFPPQPFDAELLAMVRSAAHDAGHSTMDIVSGAGHDAVYVARTSPTAMIFIPCKDGISHNEIEDALPAHITAGADVLLRVMLARAGVVSTHSAVRADVSRAAHFTAVVPTSGTESIS